MTGVESFLPSRPPFFEFLVMVDQLMVGIGFDFFVTMDLLRCLVRIGLVRPVCGGAQWHGGFVTWGGT